MFLWLVHKNLDIKKSISYEGFQINWIKENKWCIKKQAAIIFIIGTFLVPICLGCADTRTTCKAKKPWVDQISHGFLFLGPWKNFTAFFRGKRRRTT
jgi:hypothetical protein